jgi:hypothetical protein
LSQNDQKLHKTLQLSHLYLSLETPKKKKKKSRLEYDKKGRLSKYLYQFWRPFSTVLLCLFYCPCHFLKTEIEEIINLADNIFLCAFFEQDVFKAFWSVFFLGIVLLSICPTAENSVALWG